MAALWWVRQVWEDFVGKWRDVCVSKFSESFMHCVFFFKIVFSVSSDIRICLRTKSVCHLCVEKVIQFSWGLHCSKRWLRKPYYCLCLRYDLNANAWQRYSESIRCGKSLTGSEVFCVSKEPTEISRRALWILFLPEVCNKNIYISEDFFCHFMVTMFLWEGLSRKVLGVYLGLMLLLYWWDEILSQLISRWFYRLWRVLLISG